MLAQPLDYLSQVTSVVTLLMTPLAIVRTVTPVPQAGVVMLLTTVIRNRSPNLQVRSVPLPASDSENWVRVGCQCIVSSVDAKLSLYACDWVNPTTKYPILRELRHGNTCWLVSEHWQCQVHDSCTSTLPSLLWNQ